MRAFQFGFSVYNQKINQAFAESLAWGQKLKAQYLLHFSRFVGRGERD